MVDPYGRDDQFRCCMYFHVRTGTIVLGVLHILLQLVVVSTLLMVALKHDVATIKSPFNAAATSNCQPKNPPTDIFYMLMHIVPGFTIFHQSHSDMSTRLRFANRTELKKVPLTPDSIDPSTLLDYIISGFEIPPKYEIVEVAPPTEDSASSAKREGLNIVGSKSPPNQRCVDRRTNAYFSLCLALISLAFGYLLIHGVISRQPAHLLPFFCLQVFDFVVALICMLGYMSSASDISHWLKFKIASHEGVPASSVHLNSTSVSLILISASCLILAFKAYCIGMVWDCHRYLLFTNRHGILTGMSFSAAPRFPFGLFGRRPLVLFRRNRRGSRGGSAGNDLTTASGLTTGVFADGIITEPPKDSELPKYEEALSIPANAYAPPPYFAGKPTSTSPDSTKVNLPTSSVDKGPSSGPADV
ncbi:unnamed protein product [Mesocestoides corti]|uniref:Lysosomal-associated transmembrane protein 4A n=1 Tax=Mesocestoides corti TaxID=53468 RepID=A0A0R3URA7_MESCO|nr:unnamed protein product [Mesocestoides corti]